MKLIKLLTLALLIAMTGCSKKGAVVATVNYLDNDSAVSFTDLLNIYERYAVSFGLGKSFNLEDSIYGRDFDEWAEHNWVANDTAWAIQLPQYANSEHLFLSKAEIFYNSAQLSANVWNNHELWFRMGDDPDLTDGIKAMSVDCIRDAELRKAAQEYKDSILIMMERPADEWGEDENSWNLLTTFCGKILDCTIHNYNDMDKEEAYNLLDSVNDYLTKAIEPSVSKITQTEERERTLEMLRQFCSLTSFDEQCQLIRRCADANVGGVYDEFVIAIAYRLLMSGKYNLNLDEIWMIWRCLFQIEYCGLSRDSYIPNDVYNDVRRSCYLACIHHIEREPDDILAIMCASSVGGFYNMNRYGDNIIGNQASMEAHRFLPNRYSADEE